MLSGYTGERLLLTLWVGALWSIGYLAVPMAFATLDTTIAGNYAGKLFYAVNMMGVVAGAVLLLGRLFGLGMGRFNKYWRNWALFIMWLLSIVFIAYIQPEMSAIKVMDGWQTDTGLTERFGLLHKFSENLYLLLSLLGLALILTTDKRVEANGFR